MSIEKSGHMQTAIDLGWEMGDVMERYFNQKVLASEQKGDGSPVTEADMFVSKTVVDFYQARGRGVVSEEEGRTAEYGDLNAEYLDPIDGTKDFKEGRNRNPRQSIAAFSLGSVVEGQFTRGVINLPLLSSPRQYWAEQGVGAYRTMEQGGRETRLKVNPNLTEGIILVSENRHPYIDYIEAHGLRTLRLGGAVFKACTVADPGLLETQTTTELLDDEQVIGFLSDSASTHDYAAAAAILQNAGGVACGIDGNPLSLKDGKNGCVFANSDVVRRLLVDAMRVS
jgi:fructose-1,6-bisphosphatase/inositol monophosphatase family enzyme